MPESGRLTNCIWKTHQYCIKKLESNVSLAARSKHVTHYATKYSKIRIIFHSNEHILKIHKDKSTVYTLHRYIPRYLINYISFVCHLLQHFLLSNNTGYQGDHSPDNVKFPDNSLTVRALGMLSVTHIMPVLLLNTCTDANMQFTINSFRQLFPDISRFIRQVVTQCYLYLVNFSVSASTAKYMYSNPLELHFRTNL